MRSPWHETPRRRAGWFGLIAAVVVAHLLFAARVAASIIGWDTASEPRRIDVSLVQELAPAAPPPVAPPPPPPPPRGARAPHAVRAGSAPEPAASTPEEAEALAHERLKAEALALAASMAAPAPAPVPAPAPAPAPADAGASTAVAAAPAPASSSPIAGPPQPQLDWPPSTRLTYTLTGQWGSGVNLYGSAVVEWRRDGDHYQVQFDVSEVPWVDDHMLSDGTITGEGLRPRSYLERQKVLTRDPKTMRIEFGDDEVELANGSRVPQIPQSQDTASQFVQFVWLFTTHPELLKAGTLVEIPLALPKNLRRWQYRVEAVESLALPFGAIDAVHVKPIGPFRPAELAVEIWVAPTLQYLPVKVRVASPNDDAHYADLALDARPLQAARAAPVPPRPASVMTLP